MAAMFLSLDQPGFMARPSSKNSSKLSSPELSRSKKSKKLPTNRERCCKLDEGVFSSQGVLYRDAPSGRRRLSFSALLGCSPAQRGMRPAAPAEKPSRSTRGDRTEPGMIVVRYSWEHPWRGQSAEAQLPRVARLRAEQCPSASWSSDRLVRERLPIAMVCSSL